MGLFQKWPPLFLQRGHIFCSKVFTPFRLKVSTRLIVRRFKTLKMPSGTLPVRCNEINPSSVKCLKSTDLFAVAPIYISIVISATVLDGILDF